MRKNQLVIGYHYAEFRNGKKSILAYNEFSEPCFLGLNGKYISLKNLNDDLTHVRTKKFDVVKIGVMGSHRDTSMFDFVQWVWERPEVIELTMAQVEALAGCPVKIVK